MSNFLLLMLIFNLINIIQTECIFLLDRFGLKYCSRCADGTECPFGKPCPPGKYSLSGQKCIECSPGTYTSQAGSSNCTLCSAGAYCDNSITPRLCPAGTFSPSTSTKCTNCSRGYYSSAGSSSCTPCPTCYYCPYSFRPPKICPTGTYAPYPGGFTECLKAGYGLYVNQTGASKAMLCPPGYYCPHITNTNPAKCPRGTYSLGKTDKCVKCQAGSYAENETSTACLICPLGSYCCNPAIKHTECAKGTAAWTKGATECRNCIPGQYADRLGSALCISCPRNKYCCDPALPPLTCPYGSFSIAMSSYCLKCWVNMPSFGCFACPICSLPPICTYRIKIMPICISDSIVHDSSYLASIGDCNFYLELETSKKCGPAGYLKGYGYKYCAKFNDHYSSFNVEVNVCFKR